MIYISYSHFCQTSSNEVIFVLLIRQWSDFWVASKIKPNLLQNVVNQSFIVVFSGWFDGFFFLIKKLLFR